jgi:hypothetical protein
MIITRGKNISGLRTLMVKSSYQVSEEKRGYWAEIKEADKRESNLHELRTFVPLLFPPSYSHNRKYPSCIVRRSVKPGFRLGWRPKGTENYTLSQMA